MKSIDIILEYVGSIHALRRWSQELMAYDCFPVHRPDFMMRDVDALSRGPYHKVVNSYSAMTYTLHEQDTREFPPAYSASVLKTLMKSGKYTLKVVPWLPQPVHWRRMWQLIWSIIVIW